MHPFRTKNIDTNQGVMALWLILGGVWAGVNRQALSLLGLAGRTMVNARAITFSRENVKKPNPHIHFEE